MVQMLIVTKSKSCKDQGHKHLLRARCVQEFAGSTLGNSMVTDLISIFKEFIMEKGKQIKEANAANARKTLQTLKENAINIMIIIRDHPANELNTDYAPSSLLCALQVSVP